MRSGPGPEWVGKFLDKMRDIFDVRTVCMVWGPGLPDIRAMSS